MDTSWKNTRDALKDFANMLKCNKCGNEPINATRYTSCGHFFCKQCVGNDSLCIICKIPVQPIETCSDHVIESLVSHCNNIAEIIQERDLWNAATTSNSIQSPNRINSTVCNLKYRIPKKNINKQNSKGETQLHTACLKGKIQEDHIKVLLAAGANPNTKDYNGWTPLQEVVSYGYSDICYLLLKCGALPNTPGEGNRTALHEAAKANRLSEAKLLLKYSANKNVYDDYGKRPIDYCEPYSRMWNILKDENELDNVLETTKDLSHTLNKSLSMAFDMVVIYMSDLQEKNKRYLNEIASKNKIKIVSRFQSSVTHVIVEANSENVVQPSYDVMMALLHGAWLLNTEWIQLGMDISEILKGDLEIFEVSGTPIKGIPKKARENAQKQNPGLFNRCYFYFAWQSKNVYANGIQLTKEALIALVQEGGGTVLKREPNPENIKDQGLFIPFHIANEPTHSLYKCTHYIIYVPEKDEPRIKYNMPHIKTLPLIWLIECIEKFTLIDPLQLGLLKL
ncbi:BRCA1-associated RING domain protein 1-like [Bombus huntii]|uniref:BRCA1-associated RING domain protein 1-like n=1 Tax=Bombus huntii TaxID=85661 RepID=UPI0021AA0421|nr:BRCA1-associated RING domain protein 1-like [Bombus huntii]